jgi:hypothetical protein
MNELTYYRRQTKRLVKQHHKLMALGRARLVESHGEEAADAILAEAAVEFERLIPEIPYIGGKDNPLTDTLEQMISMLALYRALKERGSTVEEVGELIVWMARRWTEQFPAFARSTIGRLYMSRFWRRRMARRAAVSQQRQYAGNFVYEVVEGDGETFEWGIDYVECGVVKFFEQQAADELTPTMCQLDFFLFQALGLNLARQGTIAQGCTHCDFRFSKASTSPYRPQG